MPSARLTITSLTIPDDRLEIYKNKNIYPMGDRNSLLPFNINIAQGLTLFHLSFTDVIDAGRFIYIYIYAQLN